MNQLLDSLQAMAQVVARRPRLVLLRSVIEQIAHRVDLPVDTVSRQVLVHLQGAGAGVQLYLCDARHEALPVSPDMSDAPDRDAVRLDLRHALTRHGPGAALQARQLVEVPRQRGRLLQALVEWWCGSRERVRARGAAHVALSIEDAVAHLGFAPGASAVAADVGGLEAAASPAPASAREPASSPLVVDPAHLRKGAPAFDEHCIALCRERDRLDGAHRPMQQLVAKYGLSDGHLRECIRRGRALLGVDAIDTAQRSVFDLAAARRTSRHRRAA